MSALAFQMWIRFHNLSWHRSIAPRDLVDGMLGHELPPELDAMASWHGRPLMKARARSTLIFGHVTRPSASPSSR